METRSALILGGASCVWADAEEALKLFKPDLIAAVNNIGLDWPGDIDHWFSLHINPTAGWIGLRAAIKRRVRMGRNRPMLWTGGKHVLVDHWVDPCWCTPQAGDGGLLAVQGLLSHAVNRIVLAGVPINESPHYFDREPWVGAVDSRPAWLAHLREIAPYVRSMSGWTRDLLGAP